MATPASFVPVDQVIATAKSLLEGADTIDRAFFREWVYLGLGEIGPNTAWFDNATLYPTERSMRKPDDYYQADDIALYDASGHELSFVYRGLGERIHQSNNTLINNDTYAPALGAPIDLSEDTHYFHIGSNGDSVAYAKLKYIKYPTDENGDLLIPESDVFPLAMFCRYCFYMRKDDKQGMAMTHPIWIARRNEARSFHNTPSKLVGTELARSWNSMIKKQIYKNF